MRKPKPLKRVSGRTSTRTSARGGTLYGVGVGILMGLVAAAALAFYITRAPLPFLDRSVKHSAPQVRIDRHPPLHSRKGFDPNQGLYEGEGSRIVPRGTGAPPSTSSASRDDLGTLIASLPPRATDSSGPVRVKPVDKLSTKGPRTVRKTDAPNQYFLQVGTYRNPQEAEAFRARILLLGLPVMVSRTLIHGKFFNRVRVGPFSGVEAMNRARRRLGESRIKVAAVR